MKWKNWVLCALVYSLVNPLMAAADADGLVGRWAGALDTGGQILNLELELEGGPDEGWSAVVVSVDQGGARIPVSKVVVATPEFRLELAAIAASFDGLVSGDSIIGTWRQGGAELPLTWNRSREVRATKVRPQNPVGDLPYREVEVEVAGPAGGLAGTLTLPGSTAQGGPYPWVLLISGSGLQDRDESLFDHRPFRVLADALTRRGVAVFRYDDRGFGESGGDASEATTADFVEDARAIVRALGQRPELGGQGFGLVGHSEGALIAARLAPSAGAKAVVSIAGPALPGSAILVDQVADLSQASGLPAEAVASRRELQRTLVEIAVADLAAAEARAQIMERLAAAANLDLAQAEERLAPQVDPLVSPWMRYFLRLDPADWWREVEVPTLAIFGERDLQVSPSANAPRLTELLTGPGQSVEVFAGLNHLMQPARTGLPNEYGEIETTISPEVLERIGDFLVDVLGVPAE